MLLFDPEQECDRHRPLSDEAVVEILNWVQGWITDFENRYHHQINRYYEDRSRQSILQGSCSSPTQNELPF